MTETMQKRCVQLSKRLEGLTGLHVCVLDAERSCLSDTPVFCTQCQKNGCEIFHTYYYGCSEAYRWGGHYVYYCPAGLVLVASPLLGENGVTEGGIVAGPLVMGEAEDTLAAFEGEKRALAADLPVYPAERVHDLSEILAAVTESAGGTPHRAGVQKQNTDFPFPTDTKLSDYESARYFLDCERQLHTFVAANERAKAQALLNDLLGFIYFSSSFDLHTIKARIVELIVVLSRAVIDAGAELSEILFYNTNYFDDMERFTDLEEMSVWLSGVMHRFINYTFDFRRVKHADVVYKIMKYVRGNYHRKITLDEIARQVFLSRSYISSLFKEETGNSLTAYINHVRVEQSKRLLADERISLVDIAGMCGFEDQSYFTKVFKRETGMPPNRYRAINAGSVQYFLES